MEELIIEFKKLYMSNKQVSLNLRVELNAPILLLTCLKLVSSSFSLMTKTQKRKQRRKNVLNRIAIQELIDHNNQNLKLNKLNIKFFWKFLDKNSKFNVLNSV